MLRSVPTGTSAFWERWRYRQSLDPASEIIETLAKHVENTFRTGTAKIGPLNVRNHEHLTLPLLPMRLRMYLRDECQSTARVFVDEGIKPAGSVTTLPGFEPEFRGGIVFSGSSSVVLPLQLADFAAFGLNRTQLTLGTEAMKPLDYTLIEMYQEITPNWVNVPAKVIDFGYREKSKTKPN